MARALPAGTVTFLFTDLEGSTALWEAHGEAMRVALARHDELVRTAVAAHGGAVFKHTGDGFGCVFTDAGSAVLAAVEAQDALAGEDWGEVGGLRARMGLHTGPAKPDGGDYHAPAVNRAARIGDAGRGGQVLVSASTRALAEDVLVDGPGTVDLGEHELRGLAHPVHLHQLVHPHLDPAAPVFRDAPPPAGNLPPATGALIGRDEAVAELADRVAPGSILTLTGVGGVGKTSLALEVARRIAPDQDGGAWLVELAPVADPDRVPDAVAGSLGVTRPPTGDVVAALVDALADGSPLVVLDNCEHLLDAVADLVDDLLGGCPGLALLATSREPLGARSEEVAPVRSLAVTGESEDPGAAPAVALFLERARAAGAAIARDAASLATVTDVCRRLDGIPLAIELAAARTRSMGLDDIAGRLDERFRLLTGRRRAAVERHQTLRAAVDWSYRLLDPAAQRLFERLSVFAAPFPLEAAEAVGEADDLDDPVMDLLADLVDKSMVGHDTGSGSARYHLLETLRQYGEERLEERGEADVARRRHAEWLIGSLGQLERWGRIEVADRATIRSHLDDVRAAIGWALSRDDVALAARLLDSVFAFVVSDDTTDLTDVAVVAVGQGLDERVPQAAAALALVAGLHRRLGEVDEATALARRGLAAAGDDGQLGRMMCFTFVVAATLADEGPERGWAVADEWLAWAERNDIDQAFPLSTIATMRAAAGDLERAEALIQQALAQAPSGPNLGYVHFCRAEVHAIAGLDPERALADYREAIRLCAPSGVITGELALVGEAALLGRSGDTDDALAGFQRYLTRFQDSRRPVGSRVALVNLADLLARLGEDDVAARLCGHLGLRPEFDLTTRQEEVVDALAARLGVQGYADALERGRRLSASAALDLALDTIARLRA